MGDTGDGDEPEDEQESGGALDGDVMQQLADGRLPEQLAGATTMLQEQLKMISEEMNKLKSELYSEQGGLAEKLTEITRQASTLEGNAPSRGACGGARGNGYDSGSTSGGDSGGLRSRPRPAISQPRDEGERFDAADGRPTDPKRRVEFTSDTGNPTREIPHHRAGRMMQQRRQAEASWTPYIVGFCMLCLGPMRPLLLDVLSLLWSSVVGFVPFIGERVGAEEDVPWYDQ